MAQEQQGAAGQQPGAGQLLIPEDLRSFLHPTALETLRKLGPVHQESFVREFRRRAKKIALAYLWWMFPVPLMGVHYGYMGKWPTQFVFWATLGGFGFWWLVDAFRIPGLVRDLNSTIAQDLVRDIAIMAQA
jgi:hypothetical protein